MSKPKDKEQSPYERRAYAYIEQGYSVIPIAPGTKRPGQWTQEHGWRGMSDWERYNKRLPTEIELNHWYNWPNAGIGLLTGKLSGVIGLDRDYDTDGTEDLDHLIPYTPVKKKGAKGYTAFFQYNGEKSVSYNIAGLRVLDVLSDGRQTLMPGTAHPDGLTYIYLTEDCLEDFKPSDLPKLPDNFFDQVAKVLDPFQTEADRKYARKIIAMPDDDGQLDENLTPAQRYFRDLNKNALKSLDDWVPRLIPGAIRERDSYRTVARWRGAENPNVGIHQKGIFDFGGNIGMTPLDLVMYANGISLVKAAEALSEFVKATDDRIELKVPNVVALPTAAPVTAPAVMPWEIVKPEPPTVMLPPTTSKAPAKALPAFITAPPGILGDISRWITATAPKAQPELSLAAAIALCATVMGRAYRSQYGNFTSLYVVMVAKSTEGKEHPQGCVEKVLTVAEMPNLIGGSGYTSAGAVYSALLKSPVHIATIDELGKLLKTSRAKGQSHTEAALDKLIEAFGRQDGILRPPTYSTMTMSRTQPQPAERVIYNPAITLLGATTPGTFYESLTDDLVKDGFLGRCIVVESSQPRQLTRFVDRTEPPKKIVKWCKDVHVTSVITGDLVGQLPADLPAQTIELPFSEACRPIMDAFEASLNDEKEACEPEGLDVLLGRSLEKALKLAMIVCKAENPANDFVKPHHVEWAVKYINHYDNMLVKAVRTKRFANLADKNIKRMIEYIRTAKTYTNDRRYAQACRQGLMPHSKLLKLMKMGSREFREIVETALETGMIWKAPGSEFGLGTMDVYRIGDMDE